MPVALIVEIVQALIAVAPQMPDIIALGESAVGMLRTGAVTQEEEASVRASLDAVKRMIDAAT